MVDTQSDAGRAGKSHGARSTRYLAMGAKGWREIAVRTPHARQPRLRSDRSQVGRMFNSCRVSSRIVNDRHYSDRRMLPDEGRSCGDTSRPRMTSTRRRQAPPEHLARFDERCMQVSRAFGPEAAAGTVRSSQGLPGVLKQPETFPDGHAQLSRSFLRLNTRNQTRAHEYAGLVAVTKLRARPGGENSHPRSRANAAPLRPAVI